MPCSLNCSQVSRVSTLPYIINNLKMQSKNRPPKLIDILMQDKDYHTHRRKLSRISLSGRTKTRDNIDSLDHYLNQFSTHRDLLKHKKHEEIQLQNQQFASKLI